MKIRIFLIIVITLNLLNPAFAGLYGTDSDDTRPTLKGLPGVYVSITVDEEGQQLGLDPRQLQNDAELKLRMAGINVFNEAEHNQRYPNSAVLAGEIKVDCTLKGYGFCTKGVEVAVYQPIRLERANSILSVAPTWRVAASGYFKTDQPDYVRNEFKDDIDNFVNAYLAANPRIPK